jgi:uncharacterized Tic20 family protein
MARSGYRRPAPSERTLPAAAARKKGESMKERDTQHLRKTAAGICMVLGPIVGLVGAVIYPKLASNTTKQLDVIARHTTRFQAADMLMAVGLILMIFGVLGLNHLLRERAPMLALVGSALAIAGMAGTLEFPGQSRFIATMAGSGFNRAEMARLLKSVNDGFALAAVCVLLFVAGAVVLAVGLLRTRVVSPISAVSLGLFAIGFSVAFPANSNALLVVSWALGVAGLGGIGIEVLTESDEAWEHAPQVSGFGLSPA